MPQLCLLHKNYAGASLRIAKFCGSTLLDVSLRLVSGVPCQRDVSAVVWMFYSGVLVYLVIKDQMLMPNGVMVFGGSTV